MLRKLIGIDALAPKNPLSVAAMHADVATLQVLGVANSHDVDVVAELRGRLEDAGLVATSSSMAQSADEVVAAAVAAETAKYQSTIDQLKSNNEALRAKLKAVVKSSQDAKQRHARDVAGLQKVVSQLQQQRAREQPEVEKTDGQSNAGGGGAGGKAGQQSADTGGRVVLPPVTSPKDRPSLTTSNGSHDHHSAAPAGQAVPSSPVVMPPLMLPKTSPTTTARAAPPTTAVVLPSLAIDTSAIQHNADEQLPANLCSQVGHLSSTVVFNITSDRRILTKCCMIPFAACHY